MKWLTWENIGVDRMACAWLILRFIDENAEFSFVPAGMSPLPEGYEAQIRSRSGLAIKFGVTVLNSPGTIDADYRGEIKVILQNFGSVEFIIERSMRIAQMVVAPVIQANLIETDILPKTIRGDSGFGSTGITDQKV